MTGPSRQGRRLDLDEGQWRGDPPRGRLKLRVAGITRSTVPGFVQVSGWRHLGGNSGPVFVRVLVRAEVVQGGDRR